MAATANRGLDLARRLREQRPVAAPSEAARPESASRVQGGSGGEKAEQLPTLFQMPAADTAAAIEAVAVHHTTIDLARWPAPNFSPAELAGNSDGLLFVDLGALAALERLRELIGDKPMIINSAYRSAKDNARVGGASDSQHRYGRAFDVSMANFKTLSEIRVFRRAARAAGFQTVVDYPEPRDNFIHIDMRAPARSWKYSEGGDPGFAGERWARANADPDGRVDVADKAVATRATEAVIGAGAAAGAARAASADIDPQTLELLTILLPYGAPTILSAFGLYVVWRYWGRVRLWVSSLLPSRS